jgi:hypothetical protein
VIIISGIFTERAISMCTSGREVQAGRSELHIMNGMSSVAPKQASENHRPGRVTLPILPHIAFPVEPCDTRHVSPLLCPADTGV